MIIWRPSANKDRFFYSLVNDLEQGEEDDEIEEKFFGKSILNFVYCAFICFFYVHV